MAVIKIRMIREWSLKNRMCCIEEEALSWKEVANQSGIKGFYKFLRFV